MKQEQFILFLLICFNNYAISQKYIIPGDEEGFDVISLYDTINFTGLNSVQLTPDSLELDIDCDGVEDIGIYGYLAPQQNLPPTQKFKISHLTNDDLSILTMGSNSTMIAGFRSHDTIMVEPNDNWALADDLFLCGYSDPTGPYWPTTNPFDSSQITNVYSLYRKKKGANYYYGWIKYDAVIGYLTVYIEKIGIESSGCFGSTDLDISENNSGIKIYPNPADNYIKIESDIEKLNGYNWNLYFIDGTLINKGIIKNKKEEIPIGNLHSGAYILEIISQKNMYYSKILVQ